MSKQPIVTFAALALAFGISACGGDQKQVEEPDGPAENAGEAADEAADDAADAAKEGAEETEQAADAAADKVDDNDAK